jgi:hypothetical protein
MTQVDHLIKRKRAICAAFAVLMVVALSACGSSSNDAGTLLKQTFSGAHTVNSGNLNFSLTVLPSGSSTLTGPITLSFGGPFQSLGKGKLPASDFNVRISALGKTGSLSILSTGTSGYVSLSGTSYKLPSATFQKLESSFAQIASSPGGGSGSGALSKLGIDPLRWLNNPSVVGDESVGGTATTHVKAAVNVAALLTDLNTFLQKASSLGASGTSKIPTSIPAATRNRIASEVQNPSFDVWTGKSDQTVRKLLIGLTLPVTGQVSSLLGGLRQAQIGVSMQYANLNQPQTIQAPASVRPFAEFSAKLKTFLATVQGGLGSVTGGSTSSSSGSGTISPGSSTTSSGSSTTATGTAAGATAGYSRCIQAAGQDVLKMQRCASLLGKG